MTPAELSTLLRDRTGQEFDGECHLSAEEAEQIAAMLDRLVIVAGINSLLARISTSLTYDASSIDARDFDLFNKLVDWWQSYKLNRP